MIGGTYLAATPQISYRRLLDELTKRNFAVHTWSYVPGLDHQTQANQAWKDLRESREILQSRVGLLPLPIRLGHSLGCKLHLLAPDGGRNSKSFIALSFNNFSADRSIPMLGKLSPRIGIHTEFSPSPKETMRLILERYFQPHNLLINFEGDKLDQSSVLLRCLEQRDIDSSKSLQLQGDHLTPASAGLRESILGTWADDATKVRRLKKVAESIYEWSANGL